MAVATIIEEWRIVTDWLDYEVSSLGRVRRRVPNFVQNPYTGKTYIRYPAGYQMTPFLGAGGYLTVSLTNSQKRSYPRMIHVLVCTAFHGPKPTSKHEVAHWDGDKFNCRATNLRWATPIQNHADTVRHGNTLRGNKSPNAKLAESDVIKIRKMTGRTDDIVAREFGISRSLVYLIRTRKRWGWLLN